MPLEMDYQIRISEKFKKIIQSGNYEELLVDIMNLSKIVFPHTYKHIKKQPNGECDFIDEKTSQKYDAKLPFTNEDGTLIASNNFDFNKWLKLSYNRVEECEQIFIDEANYCIENSALYEILKNILERIHLDEDLIVLFPYQIVLDGYDMYSILFTNDILSSLYTALRKNGLIKGRKIYTIYPGVECEIVVRCLNSNLREYIPNIDLKKYIDFSFETKED